MKWAVLIVLALFLLAGCMQGKAVQREDNKLPMPLSVLLNFENERQFGNLKRVSGSWQITNGKLVAAKGNATGLAVLNNFAGEAITASVSLSISDGSAGLVFRATGPKDYQAVIVDVEHDDVFLLQYVGGEKQILQQSPISLASLQRGRQYVLTLDVNGPSVRAYLGDDVVIDYAPASVKKGRVGLWYAGSTVFDNFSAEKI